MSSINALRLINIILATFLITWIAMNLIVKHKEYQKKKQEIECKDINQELYICYPKDQIKKIT